LMGSSKCRLVRLSVTLSVSRRVAEGVSLLTTDSGLVELIA
jgi:hypothetical protein